MSKKLIPLTLTAGLCLLGGIQSASAGASLFKDYANGTSIDKYTRSAGYYDCSTAEYTARCTDNFAFIGEKFGVILFFWEGRLDKMALTAPYKIEMSPKLSEALSKSFNMISMGNEKSFIDMVALNVTAKDEGDYLSQFRAFESAALASGDISYTYLEVPTAAGFKDSDAILAGAPEDVRRAILRVFSDKESTNLVLRFDLPNLNTRLATEQAEREELRQGSDESF